MIGLKAVKTEISENSNPKGNVVHKDKALQYFFMFYKSTAVFVRFSRKRSAFTSKKKVRTNVLRPKTSLYAKMRQFLSTFFLSKILSDALFPPGPSIKLNKSKTKLIHTPHYTCLCLHSCVKIDMIKLGEIDIHFSYRCQKSEEGPFAMMKNRVQRSQKRTKNQVRRYNLFSECTQNGHE